MGTLRCVAAYKDLQCELVCAWDPQPAQKLLSGDADRTKTATSRRPRWLWLRLAILWVACAICSGLVPGMALFIDMFAHAGVFAHVCGHVDHAGGETCDRQFMILSGIFNAAGGLTLFSLLPIGLIFDRHGARYTAVLGAFIVLAGLAVLQVPLLGAQLGYDAATAWLFPLAVFATDIGALLNSQCMLGLVWHFPGRQAFVISLGNSTYQAASLLPLFLGKLMDALGLSLASCMAAYMAMVGLGAWLCSAYTPSQPEFFAEAKRVLGIPLPQPEETAALSATVRRGNAVIAQHIWDHLWTITVSSLGMTYCMLYQALAGDYGLKLFGTEAAGTRLAKVFAAMNAVVGGIVAPLGINFIDYLGIPFLIAAMLLCNCGALALIRRASWAAQSGTCFCVSALLALYLTFVLKYLLAYSPPNRIGVVQGLMFAYAMVWNVPIVLGFQWWMQELQDGPGRISVPLAAATAMATVSMASYLLRFCVVGVPACPALLPEDEVELAKPFGCRDLEEVCYVLHLDSRQKLLRQLASTDPGVFAQLIPRIDAERLAERLGERDVEELAVLLEAAPTGLIEEAEEEAEEEAPEDAAAEEEGEAAEGARSGVAAEWLPSSSLQPDDNGATEPPPALPAAADGGVAPVPEQEEPSLEVRSRRLVALVRAGDKGAIQQMIMTTSADKIWDGYMAMGEWLDDKEAKAIEREFDRLIPGRELAGMLRQRPELKSLVTKIAKHQMQRVIRGRRRR